MNTAALENIRTMKLAVQADPADRLAWFALCDALEDAGLATTARNWRDDVIAGRIPWVPYGYRFTGFRD